MKEARVWMVLGASVGLGSSAVRYLKANQQMVIAVNIEADGYVPEDVIKSQVVTVP